MRSTWGLRRSFGSITPAGPEIPDPVPPEDPLPEGTQEQEQRKKPAALDGDVQRQAYGEQRGLENLWKDTQDNPVPKKGLEILWKDIPKPRSKGVLGWLAGTPSGPKSSPSPSLHMSRKEEDPDQQHKAPSKASQTPEGNRDASNITSDFASKPRTIDNAPNIEVDIKDSGYWAETETSNPVQSLTTSRPSIVSNAVDIVDFLWPELPPSPPLPSIPNYPVLSRENTPSAVSSKINRVSRERALKPAISIEASPEDVQSKNNHSLRETENLYPPLQASNMDLFTFGTVETGTAIYSGLPQPTMEKILEDDYDVNEPRFPQGSQTNLSQPPGDPWGVFRCEHPSCWDRIDKFRFNVFADLARHYEDAHPPIIQNESFPCDYPSCKRSDDAFMRKDAYRDHLREFHLEDMPKRHRTKKREQEWFASRISSSKWWRCVRCLVRIPVILDGWICQGCGQSCESEREELRKILIVSEQDEKNGAVRIDLGLQTSFLLESLSTININDTNSIASIALSASATSLASLQSNSEIQHVAEWKQYTHTPIEFSHIEYASHKIVPFTTIKQLGHGSLGSVDAVRQKNDDSGIILARKVIRIPNMARKRLLPLIQQEVAVLRGLSHKHIVQVVSTYETTSVPKQFGILISPAGDEDLSHFLERVCENEFPEEDIQRLKKWQYCLASAVAYIHSNNIRHKDIKPSNAICKGDEIYLTDFGSAHQFSVGLTSSTEGYAVGVTKMYSAPEVIDQDRRGRPADIYSLGCVFAEMATVANGRGIEEFHDFRSEPLPYEPDRMTLCYYATAHKLTKEWFAGPEDQWTFPLIRRMLADNQKMRPSAVEVLLMIAEHQDPFICSCKISPHTIEQHNLMDHIAQTTEDSDQDIVEEKTAASMGPVLTPAQIQYKKAEEYTKSHPTPVVKNQNQRRYICCRPLDKSWTGENPTQPLADCVACSGQWSYETLDGALYHLRAVHFAATAWRLDLRYWTSIVSND